MRKQSRNAFNKKSQYVTFVAKQEDHHTLYTVDTDIKEMLFLFAAKYKIKLPPGINGCFDIASYILANITHYYANNPYDPPVRVPIHLICHAIFPGNDKASQINKEMLKKHLLKGVNSTRREYTVEDQDIRYCEASKTYSPEQKRYFRERNWANVYYNPLPRATYILANQEQKSNQKVYKSHLIVVPDIGELTFHPIQVHKSAYKKDHLKKVILKHTDIQSNLQEVANYSIHQSDMEIIHKGIIYPPNGMVLITFEEKYILIYNDKNLRASIINMELARMYQCFFRTLLPIIQDNIIRYTEYNTPVLSLDRLPSNTHVSLLQNLHYYNTKANLAYIIGMKACYAIISFSYDCGTSMQIVSEYHYKTISSLAEVIIKDVNTNNKNIQLNKNPIHEATIPPCLKNQNDSKSWGIDFPSKKHSHSSDSLYHAQEEFSNFDYFLCCGMVVLLIAVFLTSIYILKSQNITGKILSVAILCVSLFCLSSASIYLVPKVKTSLKQASIQKDHSPSEHHQDTQIEI